jgi:hypothetical protein
VARFGAVTALPDLLMTLATCELRRDFSRACGARFTDLAASGNNSGRFDAAGPIGPRRGAERPSRISVLNLTNNLLLATRRLRPYISCKKSEKAMASVMLFWGVGFATLGWLVFKIAQRM